MTDVEAGVSDGHITDEQSAVTSRVVRGDETAMRTELRHDQVSPGTLPVDLQ